MDTNEDRAYVEHRFSGQREWKVTYEIEVTADSPREAAEQAYEIMADPRSMRPILTVATPEGPVDIDLELEDDEAEA